MAVDRPGRQRGALTIGYVAGAPRVTTRASSRSTGPRAHVTGLIAGFRATGHQVVPFIVGDRLPDRLSAAGDGGAMASRTLRGTLVDAARVAANPVLGVWGWVATRAPGGIDVLYERQATYQTLGAYRPRGVPWVVESNGPFWYEASAERGSLSFPGLAKRLETAAYRRADLVVAVSENLKEILVEACDLDPERVLVVPNAVDPARFPELPSRPTDRPLTAVFVGHVIAWAGLVNAVEALARVRAAGHDVRLRVVGSGPGSDDLAARVAELGLGDYIELLGHRSWDEVPALLAEADVALSPQLPMAIGSMYHSPLKLYEYLAAGLPVIATEFPDARGLLVGPGAGWVVPPGDVDALAGALGEAAGDRERLGAMGRAGREHVMIHHTWARRAETIVDELYERGLVSSTTAVSDVGASS